MEVCLIAQKKCPHTLNSAFNTTLHTHSRFSVPAPKICNYITAQYNKIHPCHRQSNHLNSESCVHKLLILRSSLRNLHPYWLNPPTWRTVCGTMRVRSALILARRGMKARSGVNNNMAMILKHEWKHLYLRTTWWTRTPAWPRVQVRMFGVKLTSVRHWRGTNCRPGPWRQTVWKVVGCKKVKGAVWRPDSKWKGLFVW